MNDLLKTLIKPDWDDNPKRSLIIQAANLIQIGEFQLIQLAYKEWYKEDLPEDKINNIFNEYMVTGIIPMWVTYYAKDIVKLDEANVLDSYNQKYHIQCLTRELYEKCPTCQTVWHRPATIDKLNDQNIFMKKVFLFTAMKTEISQLIILYNGESRGYNV